MVVLLVVWMVVLKAEWALWTVALSELRRVVKSAES